MTEKKTLSDHVHLILNGVNQGDWGQAYNFVESHLREFAASELEDLIQEKRRTDRSNRFELITKKILDGYYCGEVPDDCFIGGWITQALLEQHEEFVRIVNEISLRNCAESGECAEYADGFVDACSEILRRLESQP